MLLICRFRLDGNRKRLELLDKVRKCDLLLRIVWASLLVDAILQQTANPHANKKIGNITLLEELNTYSVCVGGGEGGANEVGRGKFVLQIKIGFVPLLITTIGGFWQMDSNATNTAPAKRDREDGDEDMVRRPESRNFTARGSFFVCRQKTW